MSELQTKNLADLYEDKIFTISNILSILRVLTLPFFIYFSSLFSKNPEEVRYLYYALYTIAFAVLTDYLDGLFARIMKQESELGRYLDPICDKITAGIALFFIWYYHHFPGWLLVIYFIRELYTFYMGAFLYFKRGIQGRPNWWGKFGVGFIAIAVLWYMMLPVIRTKFPSGHFLQNPSIIDYILVFNLAGGMIAYTIRYWIIVFYPDKYKPEMQFKKNGKEKFRVIK